MYSFQTLKKNLKKNFNGFEVIKLAVLGDSATQLYVQAIKGYAYEIQVNFEIFEADYDQIERQVYDPTSELYSYRPEYVIIFSCTNKLMQKFGRLSLDEKPLFWETTVNSVEKLYDALLSGLKCKILFVNYPDIDDSVFGNFANKTDVSFVYQLRKINCELMDLAKKLKNLYVIDLNLLQSTYGRDFITSNRIYINTDLFPSIDFLPVFAKTTLDVILAIHGKFKKCLILDLDNTVWGGIIGDDGIENIQIGDLGIGKAFSELQLWVKQLKQRGVIIAVCSKNDEKTAKEPFEKHPDMVLRLSDIAVFFANWNNKVDNIRNIQSILNIGFDSMVFLDDNPFERNMVRTHIKEITVPELPEDPAEYLDFIRRQNLFETASFTNEDDQRTLQYQQEAERVNAQHHFTDEREFLKSLNMVSRVEPFNTFNTPRVAQLTQRSNQFNLRTIRYTEEDIQRIAKDPDYLNLAFSLEDKYGDYGLISLIIMRKQSVSSLIIDTWIMSCRVLKRNMEEFVLNNIVSNASERGFSSIAGEYIPTQKNNMVKDHYKNLGFRSEGNLWIMDLENYQPKQCYIKINNEHGKY